MALLSFPLGALHAWSDRCADPEWWNRFLELAVHARPETRALVTCLDLRKAAQHGVAASSLLSDGRLLSRAGRILPPACPQLRCLRLDGHPRMEMGTPGAASASSFESFLLLSVARCQSVLPPSFFASPYLKSLVYLDVSDIPGSLKLSLVQRTLSPATLPSLRILKARGREMDNATAVMLLGVFNRQLWSVDLSANRLSDGIFNDLHDLSFPAPGFRIGDSAIEGRLVYAPEGSSAVGKFCTVCESAWSATFSHPHRFLVDAPSYSAHAPDDHHPLTKSRLSGRTKVRSDSANALKILFSGGAGAHSPPLEHVRELDVCQGDQGITHLYLNGNHISADALCRMVRSSPGHLQHLECDFVSFSVPEGISGSWLSNARISGILGLAHVFRPAVSANLHALRIHHSLVTQLLSLNLEGLSVMTSLWVAETQLLPRAEVAYPEAFVPDMNPRLQSLVLTQIPRYSTGPLIDKLIRFLKLASAQERAIQDIRTSSRRGPATVLGLRHIRFEFEPDPREGLEEDFELELNSGLHLDAAALMDNPSTEFTFFAESNWSSSPTATTTAAALPTRHIPSEPIATQLSSSGSGGSSRQSARPGPPQPASPPPHTRPNTTHLSHTWRWNAQTFTLPIWIGPGTPSASTPAVREYMQLLRAHPRLQAKPVPASPCHVAAGVPPGECLFSAAWEAILAAPPPVSSAAPPPPPSATVLGRAQSFARAVPKPTRAQLHGMRDVVAAVKAYRAQTRKAYEELQRDGEGQGRREEVRLGEPHFHWTGKLEVLVEDGLSRSWR